MTATDTNLRFISWHKPGILPGEYTIQVKQTIAATEIPASDPGFGTTVMSFSVQGERFVLPPTEVHAVFPPDSSMGDHSKVLPHILLRRSTLPWERKTNDKDDSAPWLALLVFHDGEVGEAKTTDDKGTVIEVEKSLLEAIVPNAKELALLTHVRKRGDTELAVVISKRLPKASGFSIAHLVSLEDRFADGKFAFNNAKNGEMIRLTSLASFRFGCFDPKQSFTHLLRALNGNSGSATLRLPSVENTAVQDQLASGSVPMRYNLRQGQTTAAWYHGPLAPAKNPLHVAPQPVVLVADELLRYNSKTGMFDASYAAAWEIGRLVALQDKKFSVELHNWKMAHAKLQKLTDLSNAHPLIDLNALPLTDLEMPLPLRAWLDELSLLERVPFSYLVPDEQMLPMESIRFFWIDWLWIECLLDGAFSVGRHTSFDTTLDAEHKTKKKIANPHPTVTGVMLRSQVVSGWP